MHGISVREYIALGGSSPFRDWVDSLDSLAALKIQTASERMRLGNCSNEKTLRGGLFERRIDVGPGYRIYYGKDGLHSILLLGGGTKERQSEDIKRAQALWNEYKRRKR